MTAWATIRQARRQDLVLVLTPEDVQVTLTGERAGRDMWVHVRWADLAGVEATPEGRQHRLDLTLLPGAVAHRSSGEPVDGPLRDVQCGDATLDPAVLQHFLTDEPDREALGRERTADLARRIAERAATPAPTLEP